MSSSSDDVIPPQELDDLLRSKESHPQEPTSAGACAEEPLENGSPRTSVGACVVDGETREEEDSPFDRGRYCWVVAVACFVGQFMGYPIGHCYGLFNIALLQQFGASKAETALIGSLCTGLTAGGAAFSGIIANRIGHRLTCMIGSLLTASGFLISSFAQDIRVLYFSYGIMIGIGSAMIDLPSLLMISFYFEKYRNVVTGVTISGFGFGCLVFPFIINTTIERYSWRVSMVILAAIALQGCIAGALLKPNPHLKEERRSAVTGEETFRWSLFRKWTLSAFLFIMFTYGVTDALFFITVPHRVVLMGFSTDKVALLLALMALAFIITINSLGILFHFVPLHHAVAFGVGFLLLGLCFFNFAFDHVHFWSLCLAAVVHGTLLGVMGQVFPLFLLRVFGLQRLNSAFGYISTGEGIGALVSPAIAGAIFDNTGSYRTAIFLAAGLLVMSGLLSFLMHIYLRRKDKRAVISQD